MICPYCNSAQTFVKDSRQDDDGRYRRYQCQACGERFSTVEKPFTGRGWTRKAHRQLETLHRAINDSMQALNDSMQAVDDILKGGKFDG